MAIFSYEIVMAEDEIFVTSRSRFDVSTVIDVVNLSRQVHLDETTADETRLQWTSS
jgi:hypothetical protein